jgi:hypothetical protein
MLTTEQIETKFESLNTKVRALTTQLDVLNNDLINKVNTTDMLRSLEEIKDLIRTQATTIGEIEERLSKIILPEETRYYLEEGEVDSYQANINTLKAMMVKFDKLYKNLVAYQSNINS